MANQVHYDLPDDHKYKRTWVFNDAYVAEKNRKFFDGKTGILDFGKYEDDTQLKKTKYDSLFGFGFAHSGIIYANSDNNISEGLARHHQKKFLKSDSDQDEVGNLRVYYGDHVDNESFDFENSLRTNQNHYCQVYGSDLANIIREQFGYHEYAIPIAEASYLLTLEKHVKQRLRASGYKDLEIEGLLANHTYMKVCEWKLKIETAKYNKPPRIIVDESVVGSLPRVHFANSWKNFSKGKKADFGKVEVTYHGESSYESILNMFEQLESPVDKVVLKNNSDDAIIHWMEDGVYHRYNLDIASNDSSHSFSTMALYADYSNMTVEQRKNFFDTLNMPIRIYNYDKSRHVELKTKWGYCPSGLGDTTVVNNGAWLLFGHSLNRLLDKGFKMSLSLITLAGFLIGFRYSYSEIKNLGDIQFLKQSPALIDGKMVHSLNLGVILRFSGRCKGEIPNIPYPSWVTDRKSKAEYIQSLLTYGFFKYNRYEILIKCICPFFDNINKEEHKHVELLLKYGHRLTHGEVLEIAGSQRPILYHTRASMYSRYDLTDVDIDEFESLCTSHGYGLTMWCKLVDIVFLKDYGLKW